MKLQFNYCGVCGEMVGYEKHSSIFRNRLAKDSQDEPDVWQAYHYECVPLLIKGDNDKQ